MATTNKIKLTAYTYFPPALVEAIDALPLTRIQRYNALHMVDLIAKRSRNVYGVDTQFYPFPTAYIKQVFTEKYTRTLNPLKEAGIIICNQKYDFFHHVCYQYRVNPALYRTDADYEKVKYQYSIPGNWREENIIKEDEEGTVVVEQVKNTTAYHQEHTMTLRSLRLDIPGLMDLATEKMDKYKDEPQKRQNIQKYWLSAIHNLEKGAWYARRNTNNFRLDTNFTNMPGVMKDKIMADNGMVSLDLSNSQFAFLYTLIKRSGAEGEDIEEFGNLVANGKLYDYIALIKGITRAEAKKMMFEVNFGRHYHQTINKEMFRELFPSVHTWIVQRKIADGYKEVALMLQRFEAKVFIDQIKQELMDCGILHFTVHDSVSCKAKDAPVVLEIMKEILAKNGVSAMISAEGTAQYNNIEEKTLIIA